MNFVLIIQASSFGNYLNVFLWERTMFWLALHRGYYFQHEKQGRNMVYPVPIDPYFLALILIPEAHFLQNFDPWALIKKLIPSMFLHKILI